MGIHDAPLLFVAAVLAGALNSVAGGGGFIAFPALVFSGVAPIPANATNTIALWPGTVASTGAYRREFRGTEHWKLFAPLFIVSMLGSLAGAFLLLKTPPRTFMQIIPWLMFAATVLFTFSGRISAFIRGRAQRHRHVSRLMEVGVVLLQLCVAVYIGYYGAGAGILMLALFAIMGLENIHTMNAFKTLLASCANGVAVVTFILAKTVVWPQGVLMLIGAAIGGYLGAWYSLKLEPRLVRAFVIVVGAVMTLIFFYKAYVLRT